MTHPLPIWFAARCRRCGWVSTAHPEPDTLPATCPSCGPKEN